MEFCVCGILRVWNFALWNLALWNLACVEFCVWNLACGILRSGILRMWNFACGIWRVEFCACGIWFLHVSILQVPLLNRSHFPHSYPTHIAIANFPALAPAPASAPTPSPHHFHTILMREFEFLVHFN